MDNGLPSEPQRGGIITARAYAAPTELTFVKGLGWHYKDIAPPELGTQEAQKAFQKAAEGLPKIR